MDKDLEYKINEFIVFCIEAFKEKEKISGKKAYDIFEKYGVTEYLESGYDVLHTQGEEWLMMDIEKFLKNREYKGSDL